MVFGFHYEIGIIHDILPCIITLVIAIILTILVSKLKFFKNSAKSLRKSRGKRMIYFGIWTYSFINSLSLLTMIFLGCYIEGILCIIPKIIGLALVIIGLILSLISQKEEIVGVENNITKKAVRENKNDCIKNILD